VRVITDEMITKKLAVSDSAVFGSSDKPIGMTLYDEVTHDPYCLKMRNGTMVSEAGVCGTAQMPNVQAPMTNEASSSNDQTATSTPITSEPMASSTPMTTESATTTLLNVQ